MYNIYSYEKKEKEKEIKQKELIKQEKYDKKRKSNQ